MAEKPKAALPRKQHYVPQFYLRGFTNPRGQLFVVDAQTRKQFTTSPQNVAAERDFNRVDAEGVEPDAVEAALAKFESEIAPAIDGVREQAAFKDVVDRNAVVSLICALALRNPRKRENINRFMNDVMQIMAEMTFATRERWEGQIAQMKADGAWEEGAETDYETLKTMIKDKKFKFRIAKEFHIGVEVEHFKEMLPFFTARHWRILKARAGTGGFVTTDHPYVFAGPKAGTVGNCSVQGLVYQTLIFCSHCPPNWL
jgi:Protein of unknown function (DUF4238)